MRGRQGGSLGLLQDTQLIETLAHFSRERIPERLAPQLISQLGLRCMLTAIVIVSSMPKLLGRSLNLYKAPPRITRLTLRYRSYGEFEATRDCSDFTNASFLNKVGKKTPVLQRVSTVGFESGSADTARDIHGWAMKLYTDEGNLDWVFNNTVCLVFFL